MDASFETCPKCQHPCGPADGAEREVCAACGLVFAKWAARASLVPLKRRQREEEEDIPSRGAKLAARLIEVPARVDRLSFGGRVAVLVLFAIWSWRLARYDFRDGEIGGSFMHNIL